MSKSEDCEIAWVEKNRPKDRFTRASQLYACSWCGTDGLTEQEVLATRTPAETADVMLCVKCAPDHP